MARVASQAISVNEPARALGTAIAIRMGLALERELQARLFASADAREGVAAFVERRAPKFLGR